MPADVKAEAAAVLAARGISMAALLRELLARWPHSPRVELITTDGFRDLLEKGEKV